MSQLRENQKLLPYGRFMLGFQSPNDEHLLEGIAKSEQNAGNKILIGEISKWVVIWLLYPIPMTFMVHSTIQCPERQPFFGIILEPKEQSIHTTKRWWKLPTHSSFRRYVVNSYDINIKKSDCLFQLPVVVNQVMSILQTKGSINLACTAPCTMLGTKSRWPGASKIVNCLENNAGFWNGGGFH